ncbi:MAG: hypothetical protein ACRDGA_11400 [Bacteroidota bacterium]
MHRITHDGFLKSLSATSLKQQLSQIRLTLVLCCAVFLTIIAGIVAIGLRTGTRLDHLVIDPVDVDYLMPAYIGMLSHLGVMLWAGSAAVCLFGANLLLRSWSSGLDVKESGRFLLASGLVASGLMLDDALLLHDRVFPWTFHIHELVVFAVYLGVVLLYLYRFARKILESEYLLLLISGTCLFIMVLMDHLLPFTPLETFFEDSLKFLGIVFFFAYYARTANALVKKELHLLQKAVHHRSSTPVNNVVNVP